MIAAIDWRQPSVGWWASYPANIAPRAEPFRQADFGRPSVSGIVLDTSAWTRAKDAFLNRLKE